MCSLYFARLKWFWPIYKARHDGYDTNYTFDDILVYVRM
jgi:hypothetical protein